MTSCRWVHAASIQNLESQAHATVKCKWDFKKVILSVVRSAMKLVSIPTDCKLRAINRKRPTSVRSFPCKALSCRPSLKYTTAFSLQVRSRTLRGIDRDYHKNL
eukprot:5202126-Amphidinium_carterae.1